ncbi:PsiF family protein, partial [Roseateles sp. GG27B]
MKNLFKLLTLAAFALAGSAHAADAASAPTTQQSKMGMCNKDATGKKGDERKAFMKECLSAKGTAAAPAAATATPQQSRMKTCNADAKTSGKTGD